MKVYTLEQKQVLPITIDRAWEFFSSPENLKEITPSYMGFHIISNSGLTKMYEGQIIEYVVKPLLGIPVRWVTEISHVKEPFYFVDEQRFGPYRMWHHKHIFNQMNGETEMTDQIHYVLPFGILGRLAHYLFIRKRIEEIFDFRKKTLTKMFRSETAGT